MLLQQTDQMHRGMSCACTHPHCLSVDCGQQGPCVCVCVLVGQHMCCESAHLQEQCLQPCEAGPHPQVDLLACINSSCVCSIWCHQLLYSALQLTRDQGTEAGAHDAQVPVGAGAHLNHLQHQQQQGCAGSSALRGACIQDPADLWVQLTGVEGLMAAEVTTGCQDPGCQLQQRGVEEALATSFTSIQLRTA